MLSETCTPCSAVIPSLEAWVLLLLSLKLFWQKLCLFWWLTAQSAGLFLHFSHFIIQQSYSCFQRIKGRLPKRKKHKVAPYSHPALSPPQHCIQQLLRFCCWAFLCSSVYLFLNGRKILLLINLHSEWFEVFIKVTGKKQFPNLFHVPTVDKSGLLVPRGSRDITMY